MSGVRLSRDCLTEIVGASVARSVCEDGALGSPLSLFRLSQHLRSLSRDFAGLELFPGVNSLTDVCSALFTSRTPRLDYSPLATAEGTYPSGSPDVFGLCASAIATSVFWRNWTEAAAFFELATIQAATFQSLHVRQMVIGLRERYLSLPRDGAGVRENGSPDDLLWALNRAEEMCCRGHLDASQSAAEAILATTPSFGWVRALLIRILFSRENFREARSVLDRTEIGVVGAAEYLGWTSLLPESDTSPTGTAFPPSVFAGRLHFKYPLYFQALSYLLRGDGPTGLTRLRHASIAGDPYSLMVAHDPLIRLALRHAFSDTQLLAAHHFPGSGLIHSQPS